MDAMVTVTWGSELAAAASLVVGINIKGGG